MKGLGRIARMMSDHEKAQMRLFTVYLDGRQILDNYYMPASRLVQLLKEDFRLKNATQAHARKLRVFCNGDSNSEAWVEWIFRK
jgi:hypothetical protein